MEVKKTIMIFGISSFVGSNIADRLKKKYRVIGTYFNNPVNIQGVLTLRCDVHEKDVVQRLIYMFKPDVTIYSVGLSNVELCQDHPKVADALNTAGVFNVSNASERYKSKFVYVSSCYVFSGEAKLFGEIDTPTPSSIYGNTVTQSEFYVQKSCLNYLILRCAPIMGRSYNMHDLSWIEYVERKNFRGDKISCDTKVYSGYIDVGTLCDILDQAIEMDVTNRLFQISSKDTANRYQFTKKFVEYFDTGMKICNFTLLSRVTLPMLLIALGRGVENSQAELPSVNISTESKKFNSGSLEFSRTRNLAIWNCRRQTIWQSEGL